MVTIYVVVADGTFLLNTASFTPEIAMLKWEESSYYDPSLEVNIATFKKEHNNE